MNSLWEPSARDLREVGKAFSDWINSGEGEIAHGALAATFRRLTILTVDLAMELQRVRNRGPLKKFRTVGRYRKQINSIVLQIQERHPVRLQLRDFPGRDGQPLFVMTPFPPRALESSIGSRSFHGDWTQWQSASNGSYALRQFGFLAAHDAFANFRRCAVPNCKKYFFPQRTEGRYCSKSCQRQQYMKAPQRKKQNAADQKVYYYTHQVLGLAKFANAEPVFREKYLRAKKALRLAQRAQKALKDGKLEQHLR